MAGAIYVETYGCQMNLADSELILGHVAAHGYTTTDDPAAADVILLNTCAIREHAEERVVGRLTDLARLKARRRDLVLGMCGCMAQHHRAAVAARVPALDLVVGPDAYRRLPTLLAAARAVRADAHVPIRGGRRDDATAAASRVADVDALVDVRLDPDETYADLPSARAAGAVRAWITVMRGCDKFCTFCVVPYVRGRERSLAADAVLAQVRVAAANGAREVVFLGQTVNAYRDGDCDLAGLLCRAADVPGILRLRFTSPHPADMRPALIAAMAEVPAIAPQLHLPVQSGSDVVLTRMERGHTVADYRNLVARLRDGVPEIALSTDVIVGFPGESPADFEATCRLIEEIGYDHAFLFKYSPRTLTKAARWDDSVDEEEKGRRLAHVIALQEQISAARNRRWIGRTVEVLVEGAARRSPGCVAGKTPQFLTTVVAAAAAPGTCLTAVVTGATAHTLIASAVDAAPDDRAPRAA
ncbi:MAG: tRNA (N6-isopentenyl adenosine(37)-C2)-methylthiotransferase MiaB [Deltaproteobacteria bacterium]|nr:MAG: tRNA (N6-isopentenyl adenosine(37)-C2)-methylthiotransferase MiaB [Deltaproteobacteria bacterium]